MPAAPLRLGMVGGGEGSFIGAVHRMAARLDGAYVLVAGALSSDPERARRSGEALGLAPDRIYENYQRMAEAERARPDGVQVVSIVTPNNMHAGPARAFLEAGIHVICDKPITATLEEAEALADVARRSGCVFVLTHNYTAYPMVRQARQMIADGAIGAVRVVAVEYIQGWLATRVETSDNKQAAWRTDPARSGPGGALGDIGTHAFNLAEFVTGDRVAALAAEAATTLDGRRVDDNTAMLLRFASGARGTLWCSQVAIGRQNSLTLRVFGDRGSLEWEQEAPEALRFAVLGEPPRLIARGGEGVLPVSVRASRVPGGHPEGYLDGFATLYRDASELIWANMEKRSPSEDARLVPGLDEGLREMRFVSAALASSRAGSAWAPID